MAKIYRLVFNDRDQEGADRQTTSLAGLAVSLLVVVVSVFLIKQLAATARTEDCLLAGRLSCDPMIAQINHKPIR